MRKTHVSSSIELFSPSVIRSGIEIVKIPTESDVLVVRNDARILRKTFRLWK